MENVNKKNLEDFLMDMSFLGYVKGELADLAQWEKWVESNPNQREEFNLAVQVAKMLLLAHKPSSPEMEKSYNSFLDKISKEKKREEMSWLPNFFRLAAAIFIVVFIIASVWYFSNKKNTAGKQIITYNEITVPIGEKAHIKLSDGSNIWINSDSRVRYPNTFNSSREVYLEGEAFFDIAHNPELPFVVNTQIIKVKVLGTSFNIKSYPNEKVTETTVIRGLVSIENKIKNQSLIYLKSNQSYLINSKADSGSVNIPDKVKEAVINTNVNVEPIISWKDQTLVFLNETLEEVTVKMERWYNVKIYILNEELKKDRYRGKFMKNESINQVLEAIKITTPIKYTIVKDEVFIDKAK